MKATTIFGTIVLIILFSLNNVMAQTNKSPAKGTAAKSTEMTSTYLVIAPHSKEQCMKMMGELSSKGDAYLSKFKFGCMSGDHTAYAFLSGTSEDAVRNTLPEEIRSSAKIEKVNTFTADQINKMHKGM
jgi:hypothetical protein